MAARGTRSVLGGPVLGKEAAMRGRSDRIPHYPSFRTRRPRVAVASALAVVAATLVSLAGQSQAAAPAAAGPATCGDPGCTVTVHAKNLHSTAGDPDLDHYTFIVNDNNAKLPGDTMALSTESHSPLVATGDQGDNQVTLPDGRYLISVRAPGHKM